MARRRPAGRREPTVDRMSPTDAGFYYAESENTPLHVGSVAVFEGPAPSYGDVVRLLLGKLPLVPRYRQRVRRGAPGLGPAPGGGRPPLPTPSRSGEENASTPLPPQLLIRSF